MFQDPIAEIPEEPAKVEPPPEPVKKPVPVPEPLELKENNAGQLMLF